MRHVDSMAPASPATTCRTATLGRVAVRVVAFVITVAGVLKAYDASTGGDAQYAYDPGVLVAIGVAEMLLGTWSIARPSERLPVALLLGAMMGVTAYLLLVPPGELERYGCQCFGERFRFQDIRDHLRFNGALIVLASVGGWFSAFRPGPIAGR